MQSVKRPQSTVSQPSDDDSVNAGSQGRSTRPGSYAETTDVFDTVWRFFCSTRLALILILIIAAASLAGTLLLQAPEGVASDPTAYAQWLPQARLKYGALTDLLSALQLFDVFNSLWFRLLLAGLVINTIVCTVNRWNGIWRSISKPRVRMGEGYFRKASHSAVVAVNGSDLQAAADTVSKSVAGLRYRVLTERAEDRAFIYADKNRFGKLGTFLNHLSLVLILVGAIAGGIFGFRDRDFLVPVGSVRAVGHNTGLTIRVDQFIDEYYPEGPPKDYRSDAVLFQNGKEVARQTIRVNDPLDYNGIRFYQSFFGPAVVMEVKDASGKTIFNDGIALAWQTNEKRPVGSFTLPDTGQQVYVEMPAETGQSDPLIPAGQVRVEVDATGSQVPVATDNVLMGRPTKIGDYEYTFVREIQFTGLQVSKDPGSPIIWMASALMFVGLIMVFYFPHRRIWFLCRPGEEGRTQVLVGTSGRRDMGIDEEFRRVVNAVENGTAAHT